MIDNYVKTHNSCHESRNLKYESQILYFIYNADENN